ncbi:MAG: hypothetical protein ACYC9M_12845 [Desulfobulbaceae bacterium]
MSKGKRVFTPRYRLFVLLVSALLFAPGGLYAAVSVEGTLTIPFTAPAGGVDISLYLEPAESGNSWSERTVTIPEGENSVSYLPLDNDFFDSGTLRYYCLTNCGDIYPSGYISNAGTSYKSADARVFAGINIGVNIAPSLGYRVNGQVKLPSGETAATDISLDINAYNNEYYTVTDYQYIPTGGSTVAYSLLLPPAPTQQWVVEYSINSGGQNKYFHTGYYHNDGLSSTYIYASAQRLFGSRAYSGINLILLYAKTITGSIALPGGYSAGPGGIELILSTLNRTVFDGNDSTTVVIPEGGTSAGYTLLMPYTQAYSWEVRYDCRYWYCGDAEANAKYITTGWYGGPSAPTAFSPPGYALWAGTNHRNVNVALITANNIRGKITLPRPAPAGGLNMQVEAYDPSPVVAAFMSHSFTIPQGGTSASYSVQVPDRTNLSWRVNYRIFTTTSGYIPLGYYTTTGTTHIESKGTLLAGGVDHAPVTLQAIPDKDNDGIPDSIDPVHNIINPGILMLLLR